MQPTRLIRGTLAMQGGTGAVLRPLGLGYNAAVNTPRGIIFRQATNKDCARVIKLVSDVLSESRLPFDLSAKDADLKDIEIAYIHAGGTFEIIEDEHGRLLGTYGLFPVSDSTCELRKMYLRPEIRGIGLGREVLQRAVGHARRLGFKQIVLETISVLERAIRLYTQFGFVPTAMDHPNARVDQRYVLELKSY